MFRLVARLCLAALFATVVTAAAFAAWTAGRLLFADHVDWAAEARSRLEPLLVVCCAAAFAGVVLQLLAWFGRRRLLGTVERHLARLREAPTKSAGLASADLAGVSGAAEALAAACLQAQDAAAQEKEKLARLRALLGQVEGTRPRSVAPTHLAVASSRHRLVARLAPNLGVLNATAPLRQLLGRPAQEITARPFVALAHPDDAVALRRSLEEAIEDGEAHDVQFRVLIPATGAHPRERHLRMDVLTCYDED